jgi:uncharacterized protein YidB (DUF937 family)
MALFDSLVAEARSRLDVPDGASLLEDLLVVVTDERTGGLAGLLDAFRRAGLEQVADAWLRHQGQTPLYPSLVECVLPPRTIDLLACRSGLRRSQAVSAVALMLPPLLGALAPGGRVPAQARVAALVESYRRSVQAKDAAAARSVAV